jgi:hypothetical protein
MIGKLSVNVVLVRRHRKGIGTAQLPPTCFVHSGIIFGSHCVQGNTELS